MAAKKESNLNKFMSQLKPAKKDCCDVTIEENKTDDCCVDTNEQSADSEEARQ